MGTFDLTPDPKVLIALTHTPMQPLDALCELIDNAIDSFHTAQLQGFPIANPTIIVELPKPSELNRGEGVLRISDNGPGLSAERAEMSIKAGYTGNNPYDTLGLFGMGFNISTGKLGRITELFTSELQGNTAILVKIDLDQITRSGSYEVPFAEQSKPHDFPHGTRVAISGWWPEGNPNSSFIHKLVKYGQSKVRQEIGRRYATILRIKKIQIIINGEACTPYEPCTWHKSRYVEHRDFGQIPAVFEFDKSIGTQRRCAECTALIPYNSQECQACGSSTFRTIEEKIHGWVGIQRFDDQTEFGIDLIRNGRAIRIREKAAFFEFVDEFKNTIKDYPIDNPYGRIVGEVFLDHVPVDFLKQDFQRNSEEWHRAMDFLRGDTPLQPKSIPPGKSNDSPIFKLYQGYRRVRDYGIRDMYMGYWPSGAKKAQRISRDIETEYYEKFLQKEPGYYDDSKWWELVLQADQKPSEKMVECPQCQSQSSQHAEVCGICGFIFKATKCRECGADIPMSAKVCSACGASQIPVIEEPWTCNVCKQRNQAESVSCSQCGSERGTINPLSKDFLLENSNKSDELSIQGCSIPLDKNNYSSRINVNVYVTDLELRPYHSDENLPLMVFKGPDIDIFLDSSHSIFRTLRIQPEQLIAAEVALYIYDTHRSSLNHEVQSLSNLEWHVLNTIWGERLEDSAENVRRDIITFFDYVTQHLPETFGEQAIDYFESLDDERQKILVNNMLDHGVDLGMLSEIKNSGQYLIYVDAYTVIDMFKKFPECFFDGHLWEQVYSSNDLSEDLLQQVQNRLVGNYLNCLEDAARFLKYQDPELIFIQRARNSVEFLQQRLA